MNLLPDKARVLSSLSRAPGHGGQPFGVGVAFDGPRPPRWVAAFIGFMKELPGIAVHALPIPGQDVTQTTRPPWLVNALYARSRRAFDPFSEAEPGWSDSAPADPGALATAPGPDLGVIVWLAARTDRSPEIESAATHGALTVQLGRRRGAIPFWDEVATEQETSAVTIFWHDASLSRGRPVRRAEIGTVQGLDFTANAAEPLSAAMHMLAQLCLTFGCEGRAFEDALRRIPEEPIECAVATAYPSMLEAGRFLARKGLRSAALRVSSRGRTPRWFVAVRRNTGHAIAGTSAGRLDGFAEIAVPPGSLEMADPFLAEHGGRTWLLFEDVPLGGRKGRLACMEVSEQGARSEMVVIMERDDHLSYPCVVPFNGDLFLMPESRDAGLVNLYRFGAFPSRLEFVSTLHGGFPVVDTTPICVADRWYFFTTSAQPFMETLLFTSSRLDGPWTQHPASPVSRSVRNSRSAGHLFWRDGRLFRPTQDCSVRYGYAITVNEVTRLTATAFEERPVSRVLPTWAPKLLGTHTWNESSRLQVIDGLRF